MKIRLGRIPLAWMTGLGVLTAGVAGMAYTVTRPTATVEAAPAPSVTPPPSGLVCFGHVDVEGGVATLAPLAPGRVAHIDVHEGDTVRNGATLLRLDDALAQARVQEAKAALDAARAQLRQAEQLVPQHRLKLNEQQAAVAAAGHRLEAARLVLARKRAMARLDHIDIKEADAAEPIVRELESAQQAERDRLEELRLADPATSVDRARADVAVRQSQLAQAERSADECILRAPAEGTVLRILTSPGDIVGVPGKQTGILFCPARDRIIRAEVEQEFAGRVALGQSASIQDDTTAGPLWKGRVLRISDWYTHRRSILQEPFQFNDVRTLECLIAVEPGQPPLRIGQRVRVAIGSVP